MSDRQTNGCTREPLLQILTDAGRLAVLGPVPVARGVAPAALLAQQDVARVAVELDFCSAKEVEGGLAAVRGRRESAARYHCRGRRHRVHGEKWREKDNKKNNGQCFW